jgi:hypothetical protein
MVGLFVPYLDRTNLSVGVIQISRDLGFAGDRFPAISSWSLAIFLVGLRAGRHLRWLCHAQTGPQAGGHHLLRRMAVEADYRVPAAKDSVMNAASGPYCRACGMRETAMVLNTIVGARMPRRAKWANPNTPARATPVMKVRLRPNRSDTAPKTGTKITAKHRCAQDRRQREQLRRMQGLQERAAHLCDAFRHRRVRAEFFHRRSMSFPF